MQKNLFLMAAASALMLTACSSENDVLQNAAQPQQTVVDRAVGFDVYTPSATNVTRAGLVGTMTTNRMQLSEAKGGGFGVYAFLTEDTDGDATATAYTPGTGSAAHVPNFMVNEKLLWNNTNLGWYYNPLKYWPNETNKDSQTTPAYMENDNQTTPPAYDNMHLDRLTFFAYAPYVPGDDGSGTGITYITDKAGELGPGPTKATPKDPTVSYKLTTSDADVNPDEGVDLLWGVAPAGGLSYTAVNGTTVTVDEGKPLIDMTKPDVNTSMKFLFNHALARFGFTVVAAVDQVSPGGELDPNTKITINKLKITGPFGTYGNLNLNNGTHANVANWTQIKAEPITSTSTNTGADAELILQGQYKADGSGDYVEDESTDDDRAKNAIAPHLRWTKNHPSSLAEQTVVGVTTAKQDLLRPSTKWFNKLASTPAYNPGKKYVDENGAEIHASYSFDATSQLYTVDGTGVYTQKASGAAETSPAYPAGYPTNTYYVLTETGEYIDGTGVVAPNLPAGTKFYTRTGAGTPASPYVYANATPSWGSSTTHYYTVEGRKASCADIPFAYAAGTFYEAERNYIYVVPTNNLLALNSGISAGDANDLALRTIEVQIEYYITTEDSKLADLRAQTKNVITKKVVLPSLANGKSYNLNMVLGLTSVKIEAEVDDWKVVNSQIDLPQNTAE